METVYNATGSLIDYDRGKLYARAQGIDNAVDVMGIYAVAWV
jgi:hypothetical protein